MIVAIKKIKLPINVHETTIIKYLPSFLENVLRLWKTGSEVMPNHFLRIVSKCTAMPSVKLVILV